MWPGELISKRFGEEERPSTKCPVISGWDKLFRCENQWPLVSGCEVSSRHPAPDPPAGQRPVPGPQGGGAPPDLLPVQDEAQEDQEDSGPHQPAQACPCASAQSQEGADQCSGLSMLHHRYYPTNYRYTDTRLFIENPQLFQHFSTFTRSCWYCTCSGSPCAWGWSSWAGEATRQSSEQWNSASEQPPVPEPLLGLHQPQRPRPRLLRRDQARHPPQEEECRGRVLPQGGRGSDPREEDKYLRRHFWHNSLHRQRSYIIKGA